MVPATAVVDMFQFNWAPKNPRTAVLWASTVQRVWTLLNQLLTARERSPQMHEVLQGTFPTRFSKIHKHIGKIQLFHFWGLVGRPIETWGWSKMFRLSFMLFWTHHDPKKKRKDDLHFQFTQCKKSEVQHWPVGCQQKFWDWSADRLCQTFYHSLFTFDVLLYGRKWTNTSDIFVRCLSLQNLSGSYIFLFYRTTVWIEESTFNRWWPF